MPAIKVGVREFRGANIELSGVQCARGSDASWGNPWRLCSHASQVSQAGRASCLEGCGRSACS